VTASRITLSPLDASNVQRAIMAPRCRYNKLESGGFAMFSNRLVPGLVVAFAAATAAISVGSTLGKAQNDTHMNHAQHTSGGETGVPTMPGQEVFGTIQEIVRILEADPSTDWSKANIAALREHLIDMDEVTMRAAASERALDNGVEITITGQGRTLEAIKRMVPAHAQELAALGWQAKTEDLPIGVKLVVTTTDPRQVAKLKGLSFMGIMVQGSHHQLHHLMMAKGEHVH
jgi:hypothetical protein